MSVYIGRNIFSLIGRLVHLSEYIEPLRRHQCAGHAISPCQHKISIVSSIRTIGIKRSFIRIGKVSISKRIDISRSLVGCHICQISRNTQRYPFIGSHIYCRPQSITIRACTSYQTIIFIVPGRHIISTLITTSGKREMMTVGYSCTEQFIKPIGRMSSKLLDISILLRLCHSGIISITGTYHADSTYNRIIRTGTKSFRRKLIPKFLLPSQLFSRIHQICIPRWFSDETYCSGVIHLQLPGFTSLSRNDNYSSRCLRTINSRSRGIFQYSNRFYILRTDTGNTSLINICKISASKAYCIYLRYIPLQRDSVDYPQRLGITCQSLCPTYTNLRLRARLSRSHFHTYTGQLPLQQLVDRSSGISLQLLRCHDTNRAGNPVFRRFPITGHNDLPQFVRIIFQHNIKITCNLGSHHFRFKSQKRNTQSTPLFGEYRKPSILVGNRTVCRPFFPYRSSCQRLLRLIINRTGNLYLSGIPLSYDICPRI